MKAHVGDRLIVESTQVGQPRRVGVIVALHHPDGSPPYLVRWIETGHVAVFFPGTNVRVERHVADEPAGP